MSGVVKVLAIELDTPDAVYFSGTNVSGTVIVELSQPLKTCGVSLLFYGRAYVCWTDGDDTFTDQEVYANEELILWGKPRSYKSELPQMPAGQHRFPFHFPIPVNSPTSFKGGNGDILYYLQATVDKPWKSDYQVKKELTVVGPVDLNVDSRSQVPHPVSNTGTKSLGGLCCASGNITTTVTLPKTDYVVGESVQIDVRTANNSTQPTRSIEAKIVQTAKFESRSYRGCHVATNLIANEKRFDQSAPGENKSYKFNLQIPQVPPSLSTCSIIKVNYSVVIKLVPYGSSSLDVGCPITLGTVPLRQTAAESMPNMHLTLN